MNATDSSIPEEAIKAAADAISECSAMRYDGFWSRIEDLEPEDREYALTEARAALEAASPYLTDALANAWQSAYTQGVEDERTSAASGTDYGPNRNNPYRSQQ